MNEKTTIKDQMVTKMSEFKYIICGDSVRYQYRTKARKDIKFCKSFCKLFTPLEMNGMFITKLSDQFNVNLKFRRSSWRRKLK